MLMGNIKKHYNDYTEQNVFSAIGTTPLLGTLGFYWKDGLDYETVDPETIEELIEFNTAEDIYNAAEFKEVMKDVLDSLTRRERKVLRLRFGIGMNHDYTLEEIAKLMDLSKERVRQLEAKALRKMRHYSRTCQLIDYTDI
jgi:RNA polymerase sigma factor (sigma-70 family)